MDGKNETTQNATPNWPLTQEFRASPAFNYEDHPRQPVVQTNPFHIDTQAVRTSHAVMPQFFPRFGIQFSDIDYRFNDFQRAINFGACNFGQALPTHQIAQFSLASSIPNTVSLMEGLQLPLAPPVLQNQSVIQRAPPSESETSEKPPQLVAEFSEKIERAFKQEKPISFLEAEINAKSESKEGIKFSKTEYSSDPPLPKEDDPAFGPQFYSRSVNSSITTSTNFVKPEPSTVNKFISQCNFEQDIFQPPNLETAVEFARLNSDIFVKKEYSPLHDCQVCMSTHANGLHFGARTCAACAAFFRRTISDDKRYVCKRNQRCHNASRDGTGYRKICRSCRMKRCLQIGMLPENVQHKRSRRESTPPRKHPFDNFFPSFYSHVHPST